MLNAPSGVFANRTPIIEGFIEYSAGPAEVWSIRADGSATFTSVIIKGKALYPVFKLSHSANFSGPVSANTWTYTGASVSVPANSVFTVTAQARYGSTRELGIAICNTASFSAPNVLAMYDNRTTYTWFSHPTVSYTGATGTGAVNLYVFALCDTMSSAQSNSANINGFYTSAN